MREFNYQSAVVLLKDSQSIDYETSFDLARYCSDNLNGNGSEGDIRDIVIRALDIIEKIDSSTHSIWNDLTEIVGLYPYLDENNYQLVLKLDMSIINPLILKTSISTASN